MCCFTEQPYAYYHTIRISQHSTVASVVQLHVPFPSLTTSTYHRPSKALQSVWLGHQSVRERLHFRHALHYIISQSPYERAARGYNA
jgi:hypothetical protein